MGLQQLFTLRLRRFLLAIALLGSVLLSPSNVNAEVSDADLKAAIFAGTQVKSSMGCHSKTNTTGFLEMATGPGKWVYVNEILGWFMPPECAGGWRPWTIALIPKGAVLRWTVTNPAWGRSYSSNPLETYAGPDPIAASGYFELKKGCYERGYSAILQYRKSDGSWSFVSDAFGWSVAPDCPSATPVRPWAVTLMTLPPGTQYRWNIYFPGGFTDLYTDPEVIPYPVTTTTTTTSTIQPTTIRGGQRVIVCVSSSQKIRVIGMNPRCPKGFRRAK
jgi:hypothetical protein